MRLVRSTSSLNPIRIRQGGRTGLAAGNAGQVTEGRAGPVQAGMNNIEAGGNEHHQRSAAGLEDTEIPDLVARALSLGWSVIPCRADKRPCLAWKQFQSRTPTPKEIQSWHSRYNPSAWAVITGAVSGVVVLDFDGEAGDRTRTDLKLTPHVKTGSGGSHVYVDHPGWGTKTVNGRGKTILGEQFPGLDIRGDGGYAVFFGQNESGTYQWVREMRPDPLETLPNNVRNLLGLLHPPEGGPRQPPASSDSQTNARDRVAADHLIGRALEQAGGGRNDAGFWLAAQLRDNGYSRVEADVVLSEFASRVPPSNNKGHDEPYTRAEALASVEQAYQHSPREPWAKPRPRIAVKSPIETVPSEHPKAADLDGFRFSDLANAELMVKGTAGTFTIATRGANGWPGTANAGKWTIPALLFDVPPTPSVCSTTSPPRLTTAKNGRGLYAMRSRPKRRRSWTQ